MTLPIQSTIDLNHYMLGESTLKIMMPGDLITKQPGYMHGHGTYADEGSIYSSLLGTVHKTNKLITVSPLRACYSPQIGDIVVGRVIKIKNKCWRIDIGASSHAILNLNSTYFPEHRKKNEDDELNMRNILTEDDILVAQVHSLNNDRTVNLHTRNSKYGRLEPGVLVVLDHKLVKRQKHHMTQIDGVPVIFSNNGWIWLSNTKRTDLAESFQKSKQDYSVAQIQKISIIRSILKYLDWQSVQISPQLIAQMMQQSRDKNPSDILHSYSLQPMLKQRIRMTIPSRIQDYSKGLSYE